MNLRVYLADKRIRMQTLADAIGCSRIHLYEVKNGKRLPSHMLCKAIENFTNGEVKVSDLRDFENIPSQKKEEEHTVSL